MAESDFQPGGAICQCARRLRRALNRAGLRNARKITIYGREMIYTNHVTAVTDPELNIGRHFDCQQGSEGVQESSL